MRERIFRYVNHERVVEFLALGWIVRADLGNYHGEFSLLMEWLCDCKPIEPRRRL